MHDPYSETLDPCNSESELNKQTWQSAHVTVTKPESGWRKHCRGCCQEWPAQALPWPAGLAGAFNIMAGWAGAAGPVPDV